MNATDLSNIEKWINGEKNLEGFVITGYGSYGEVYRYKNYAIKKFYTIEDSTDVCNHDPYNLKKLQKYDRFPKLYFYTNEFMVTEFIEGCDLPQVELLKDLKIQIENNWKEKLKMTLQTVLNADLHLVDLHPGNIRLKTDGTMYLCDVGLFHEKESGSKIEYVIHTIEKFIKENHLI